MKCNQCGYENPPNNQYCENCGFQLTAAQSNSNAPIAIDNPIICPTCKNPNPQGSAFCESCGTTLPNIATSIPNAGQIYQQAQNQKKTSLILPDNAEIVIDSRISIGRFDLTRYADDEKIRWISRQHFNIFQENGIFYIEDEQSANGTKLNGQEIRQQGKQQLKDKDEIIVGDAVKLVFKQNP